MNPLDYKIQEARSQLRGLRRDYSVSPQLFTEEDINDLRKAVMTLESLHPIETIQCPSCHGGGTQRWMVSYKHECNRCHGLQRVVKTLEIEREHERTWARPRSPEERRAPGEAF